MELAIKTLETDLNRKRLAHDGQDRHIADLERQLREAREVKSYWARDIAMLEAAIEALKQIALPTPAAPLNCVEALPSHGGRPLCAVCGHQHFSYEPHSPGNPEANRAAATRGSSALLSDDEPLRVPCEPEGF